MLRRTKEERKADLQLPPIKVPKGTGTGVWDMLGACEIEIKQHSLERIPVKGDMCLKSMGRILLLKILPSHHEELQHRQVCIRKDKLSKQEHLPSVMDDVMMGCFLLLRRVEETPWLHGKSLSYLQQGDRLLLQHLHAVSWLATYGGADDLKIQAVSTICLLIFVSCQDKQDHRTSSLCNDNLWIFLPSPKGFRKLIAGTFGVNFVKVLCAKA